MAEQGLKATIIPKMDESALDVFINNLKSSLSTISLKAKVNVEGDKQKDAEKTDKPVELPETPVEPKNDTNGTDSKAGGDVPADGTEAPSKQPSDLPETHEEKVSVEKEAQDQANEEDANNEARQEKKNRGLFSRIDSLFTAEMNTSDKVNSVVSAMSSGFSSITSALPVFGGFMLSITDVAKGIFSTLRASSGMLNTTMGLFDTALSLVLMPIGNILARQMIPVLKDMYARLGEWFKEANEIYDKEGWTGIIRGAIKMGLDILSTMWTTVAVTFVDGLKQDPVIGPLFQAVSKFIDWMFTHLELMINLMQIYFATDIGFKVAEATTGVFSNIPGVNLLLGGIAGVGTYAGLDWLSQSSGLKDVARTTEDTYRTVVSTNSTITQVNDAVERNTKTSTDQFVKIETSMQRNESLIKATNEYSMNDRGPYGANRSSNPTVQLRNESKITEAVKENTSALYSTSEKKVEKGEDRIINNTFYTYGITEDEFARKVERVIDEYTMKYNTRFNTKV